MPTESSKTVPPELMIGELEKLLIVIAKVLVKPAKK